MKTVLFQTLAQLAAEDARVTLLVGDLGFGAVGDFVKRFPKQFFNVGVAEQNMMGLAAGLAMSGKIVFTYSIANFASLRCLEQIRNDVCYPRANVKIVAIGCGFAYGPLGSTHHATEDLAVLRSMPHMTVLAPGDLVETAYAVRAAARLAGPCYLRLGRSGEPALHHAPIPFEVGKALVVRPGADATLISTGSILPVALRAADILATEGYGLRVLSMHTVKPLDSDAVLAAARETGVVVTLEEHSVLGGLGGAVAEVLAEAGLAGLRFKRLGLPSVFAKEVGEQDYLRELFGLSAEAVARAVRDASNGVDGHDRRTPGR